MQRLSSRRKENPQVRQPNTLHARHEALLTILEKLDHINRFQPALESATTVDIRSEQRTAEVDLALDLLESNSSWDEL